jgi:anti-sigma regulatory factor (Ser/Thr protein kinase)
VAEPESDTIRLSVPADADMRPVVEVAIGVLARRWGLSDDEITAVRAATGDVLTDLARERGADPVQIAVDATPHHLEVRITHGGIEHVIQAPPP